MTRRHWRVPHSSLEQYYGLGTISGTFNGWDHFGHSGGWQGYLSRTLVFPQQELTVTVLTNAIDGWAHLWVDGTVSILQAFAKNGAPTRKVRDWAGRWWTLWGAVDLVPMGDKVLVAAPGFVNPFLDAGELAITGRNTGRVALGGGYGSHGERVRCRRTKSGRITELWLAGSKFLPAAQVRREMEQRYGGKLKRRRRRKR